MKTSEKDKQNPVITHVTVKIKSMIHFKCNMDHSCFNQPVFDNT